MRPPSIDRETITGDAEAVARVDNQPLDPTFKGSFLIPGTETRLRVGGFARVDFIHDFRPIGSTDDFVVATIPVDAVSDLDNSTIHARETRFNFELRRPSRVGSLRVLFEYDFFADQGERALNLRHAYGQIANLLLGFTVSTLQDVDARPDILDYEGPPGRISARQAQIRYTLRLSDEQSVAIAAEEPKPNIAADSEHDVTIRTPWPDMIVRYRMESRRSHLQVGAVFRSLGGFAGTGIQQAQVLGSGLAVSGSWAQNRRNIVLLQTAAGRGLSRYIKDTSNAPLDLAVDSQGRVRAVPLVSAVAGFQRGWTTTLRSTFAASLVEASRIDGLAADAYRESRYLSANIMHFASPFTIGIEYGVGRFETQNGHHNWNGRVQVALQYDLVK
ncbi:MAG TPA: DcaP family trimeric outer membrane transporter [Vicinamibacterales bacterium]